MMSALLGFVCMNHQRNRIFGWHLLIFFVEVPVEVSVTTGTMLKFDGHGDNDIK